jgi:tetratricopeptide (TPR) repeat protein
MRTACLKAIEIFPEDPVWNYNLACAYAKVGKVDNALKVLEKAIRFGYRDSRSISNDIDLKSISDLEKFHELLDLADQLHNVPVAFGPLAVIPAKAKVGENVILDEYNFI